MPKISVVIPLYNKASFIKTSIDSVLNQTYDDYEIIIVDDGSTDKSVEVIKSNYSSEKIRIIKKENGGPSSARNRGVQESKGEWVVFLDADDMLLPFALEFFSDLIRDHSGINYFVCNYFLGFNGKAKLFSTIRHEGILRNAFFYEAVRELTERPGSSIIRREILLQHPFNEKLRRYEDAECQYNIMREIRIYQSFVPVMICDRDASSAAFLRKDYREDFICNLVFKGKSFWEQMSLYLLALECKSGYPDQSVRYNNVYRRLDFKIVHIFLKIRFFYYRLFYSSILQKKEFDYVDLMQIKNYGRIEWLHDN